MVSDAIGVLKMNIINMVKKYQKQNGRVIAKHRTKNIHKSNRKALIFIKCSSHIKHNIPNTIRHENALYKK